MLDSLLYVNTERTESDRLFGKLKKKIHLSQTLPFRNTISTSNADTAQPPQLCSCNRNQDTEKEKKLHDHGDPP